MWDLPGPGLEPVSPALAGGFLTTAPPGKPHFFNFKTILKPQWPPSLIITVQGLTLLHPIGMANLKGPRTGSWILIHGKIASWSQCWAHLGYPRQGGLCSLPRSQRGPPRAARWPSKRSGLEGPGEGVAEEINRCGRSRGTKFQLQNKWITGTRCTMWRT